MNYFIFASNLDNATPGGNDLVGVYQELSDENIFYALADVIALGRLQPGRRIRIEAFNHVVKTIGERRYWEFRMARELQDAELKFSTIRENVNGLGVCGLVPLGRRVEQVGGAEVLSFYALLDLEHTDLELLP